MNRESIQIDVLAPVGERLSMTVTLPLCSEKCDFLFSTTHIVNRDGEENLTQNTNSVPAIRRVDAILVKAIVAVLSVANWLMECGYKRASLRSVVVVVHRKRRAFTPEFHLFCLGLKE